MSVELREGDIIPRENPASAKILDSGLNQRESSTGAKIHGSGLNQRESSTGAKILDSGLNQRESSTGAKILDSGLNQRESLTGAKILDSGLNQRESLTGVELREGERLDDLMRSGRKIIQNQREFCFSMDSVLIAHFPNFKRKFKVLDLGTGTGVIPLLIADEVAEICAIELNPLMAETARRNVELNNLAEKITVVEGDYRQHREIFRAESFDLVVANPPYVPVKDGDSNKLHGVARARHEFTATLEDVVAAARFALKFRGSFCMIHLAARLTEIVDALHRHQFEMKRLQIIQPKCGRNANLIMLEAVVGANAGSLKILPPLVVHEPDGSYTAAVKKIYGV